jgi:DNA-binding transcriptional MerR regulator
MHIGELARRTGLSVKTIRFYSDAGLVPEADRSPGGYRRYDAEALVRLEFVRTLRDLGLDLATIRRILENRADLREVAEAHAEALGAQIRLLRTQRAALRALARRKPTPREVDRMNRIAQATAEERRRILDEFLDSIFSGTTASADFQARMRSVSADLPDDPTDEQVDAWIELAELVADQSFRDRLRAMGQRSSSAGATPGGWEDGVRTANLVSEKAGAAVAAGIAPDSPSAAPVVDELVGAFATAAGRVDGPEYRAELAEVIEAGNDPRAERYWQLLGVINGWPPVPSTSHLWGWFAAALRAGA